MSFDNLLVERDASDPSVAVVTINRPQVLNALNHATINELGRAMHGLQVDDGVRAVVLTGAGEKAFVAGADITEFASQTPASARAMALAGQRVFHLIEHLGKP